MSDFLVNVLAIAQYLPIIGISVAVIGGVGLVTFMIISPDGFKRMLGGLTTASFGGIAEIIKAAPEGLGMVYDGVMEATTEIADGIADSMNDALGINKTCINREREKAKKMRETKGIGGALLRIADHLPQARAIENTVNSTSCVIQG